MGYFAKAYKDKIHQINILEQHLQEENDSLKVKIGMETLGKNP